MGDTKTDNISLGQTSTDNSSPSQISAIKLDGAGTYLAWSRSCLLFIKSRKMLGYISGEKKAPVASNATYGQWDSENSLVMTWLLNTMHPRISKQYLLLDTAEKIWNSAKRTYSRKGNDAQIFEIRNKIHATKQGELTITEYYSELTGLWQEIDYYQDLQAKCTEDAVLFQQLIEKERVYDFLAGLNQDYDQIRVQVLGKTPFPSLEDAYSYVQHEETRRGVMLFQATTEKSGLSVSHEQPRTSTYDKNQLLCDYCGEKRHTREYCWKLKRRKGKGRGGNQAGSSRGQANMAETVETFQQPASEETLSSYEVQHLRRLLTKLDSSSVAKSNYVQSGTALMSHLNSWIIDSGANRHMTSSSNGFQNYLHCPKGDYVKIANGSLTPICGTGSVVCTPNITLSSVLHVPEIPVNLLSISSITKDLNCKIEFFPDHCIFQDLQTGKRIGSGRLHDGLYMIDGTQDFGEAYFGGTNDVNQEIIQWHRRGWTVGGTPIDLHDPRLLAMAAAERRLLEADYDEYSDSSASGAAFCRSAALILMALLLLRHALTIGNADEEDDDVSTFFSLFLLRAAGFLLPCYIIAWAISIIQRRRQRQEAAALAAAEVAFLLQAGQHRGLHVTVAPAPVPPSEPSTTPGRATTPQLAIPPEQIVATPHPEPV